MKTEGDMRIFFTLRRLYYDNFRPQPLVLGHKTITPTLHSPMGGIGWIDFHFEFDEINFVLRGPRPVYYGEIEWIGNVPTEDQLVLIKLTFL